MQRVYKKISKKFRKFSPVLIAVALFATVGAYFLFQSFAATPTASFEVESGTPTAPATEITDSTASGGSTLKFGPPTTSQTTILNSNFDNLTVGSQMSSTDFRTAMGDSTLGTPPRTSVVSESGAHGKFVRTTLPAKTSSNTLDNVLGGDSGIVAFPKLQLSQTVTEASIQYDIRFANNSNGTTFEWKGGGKLPGLGGSSNADPGQAAACNAGVSTAWSGRGMWIGPSAYSSVTNSKGNEWIGYLYSKYKTDSCGDNQRTSVGFSTNTWHTIKQYYKLNTVTNGVGNADGIHKMWLDNFLVKDTRTIKYRDNTSLSTNYIYWAIFRGGSHNDPAGTWDSARPGIIDIDNLLIQTPGI